MKKTVFVLLMFTGLIASAQFGPQQIISESINPNQILPIDIDNDGDLDILTASTSPYNIGWFENENGAGVFGAMNVLSDTPQLILQMAWVDMDGDSDKDIIMLRNNPRELVWFENEDGNGSFSAEQLMDYTVTGSIQSFTTTDLDDDGDHDIIVTVTDSIFENLIWFENLGDGTLGPVNELVTEYAALGGLALADIDNDGLEDIVVSDNQEPARILWLKNQGDATFGAVQEIYQFQFIRSDWTRVQNIQYKDLNNDGKKDLVLKTSHDDLGSTIVWMENIDNNGTFELRPIISETIDSFQVGDFDNDADNDVLLYHFNFDHITWLENEDGNGLFDTERTVTTLVEFPRAVRVADINNDEKPDVVSGSVSKLAWYENTGVFNVDESNIAPMFLYPNPAESNITVTIQETPTKITVYNLMGQSVAVFENTRTFDISFLSQGNYLLSIEERSGNRTTLGMIKE